MSKRGDDEKKPKRGRGFGSEIDDSFRTYMARKIDLQRKQFGVVLPPTPVVDKDGEEKKKIDNDVRPSSSSDDDDDHGVGFDVGGVLDRLKQSQREQEERNREETIYRSRKRPRQDNEKGRSATASSSSSLLLPSPSSSKRRTDLFLLGVVVLVNGLTDPDATTLQRMLHRHGGDLEKYESRRVTHIIAEQLSTAKALIYKRQRSPIPVCKPRWIVDCVARRKRLPHADYLIDELRPEENKGMRSFFRSKKGNGGSGDGEDKKHSDKRAVANVEITDGWVKDSLQKENESSSHKFVVVEHNSNVGLVGIDQNADKDENCSDGNVENIDGNGGTGPAKHDLGVSNVQRVDRDVASSTQYPPRLNEDGDRSGSAAEANPNRGKKESDERPRPQRLNGVPNNEHARSDKGGGRVVRTVGTDPNFLQSYFSSSRLSFIGSYQQRMKPQTTTTTTTSAGSSSSAATNKGTVRIVLHVDMDCFFAAVVLRNHPQHVDRPVAIGHCWSRENAAPGRRSPSSSSSTSELSTCNYVARKYGVRKGMWLDQARILCPDLVVLPYDYDGYEEVSGQVADILHRHADAHGGSVEQVSCDEFYVELRVAVGGGGDDDDGEALRDLVVRAAETLRAEIAETTRCTASVGGSRNKFLAKLATDRAKPDGSFVVVGNAENGDDEYWRELLRDLTLRELHGVGRKMEEKLKSRSIVTVQDVWNLGDQAKGQLCEIVGRGNGEKILQFCYGKDTRPVAPAARKTIGAECNYGVRFDGPYGVDYMISGLAAEVEKRMKSLGVFGQHITLKIKQKKKGSSEPAKFNGHGICNNLSKSCDASSATCSSSVITKVAMSLFNSVDIEKDDIRGMGIVMSKLSIEGNESCNTKANDKNCLSSWIHRSAPEHDHQSRPKNISESKNNMGKKTQKGKNSLEKSETIMMINDTNDTRVATYKNSSQHIGKNALTSSPRTDASHNYPSLFHHAVPNVSQIDQEVIDSLPNSIQEEIKQQIKGQENRNNTASGVSTSEENTINEVIDLLEDENDSISNVEGSMKKKRQNNMSLLSLPPTEGALTVPKQVIDLLDDENESASSKCSMNGQSQTKTPSSSCSSRRTNLESTKSPVSSSTNRLMVPTLPNKIERTAFANENTRTLRQVSVKRMLKLASVKSGRDKLQGMYGSANISLTQFEFLPLEMQLQLANNDEIPIGSLNVKKTNKTVLRSKQQKHYRQHSDDEKYQVLHTAESNENIELIQFQHSGSNYTRDNLTPLRNWMDSRSSPSHEDVEFVGTFFRTVIIEKRLDELVPMLRHIKRREDLWSLAPFNMLLENVNDFLFLSEKKSLEPSLFY